MAKRKNAVPVKIAYIGGGSRLWAVHLMMDLALASELTGELVLYDIDHAAAKRNVTLGRKVFKHKDAKTTFAVRAASAVSDALRGADFVVLSIQPGPLEMFANDLDIPAAAGVLQAVGDTTGPGGISRALRSIPIYTDYAHKIMRYCPKAWVINYTNPMTLCTAALYAAEPEIKAFGCCHEVFGTQSKLGRAAKLHFGLRAEPKRHEIKVDVTGVNHFTWVTKATWQGNDLLPHIDKWARSMKLGADHTPYALESETGGHWFRSKGAVAYDLFRRFGDLAAAGDRHLAEFVPYYLRDLETVRRFGFVLTPSAYRLSHYERGKKRTLDGIKPSGEEGVDQMAALVGIRPFDTNVNLPNRGQAPDLPLGAVVETNAQFRHDSVTPVVAGRLRPGSHALVERVVRVQQMTLTAGLEKDLDLATQAMLNDPLVTIGTDEACAMFRKLLKANKAMMKGWKV